MDILYIYMDLVHDAIANSIHGIAMDFTISAKIRANMGKYLIWISEHVKDVKVQ